MSWLALVRPSILQIKEKEKKKKNNIWKRKEKKNKRNINNDLAVLPSHDTPSRAHTARNSGQRRTMFSLSEVLFLWSALLDSASGLPMVRLGQWWNKKSNLARCKDQWAWRQLSFLAVMKYLRFLWSVQISTRWVTSSRKCLHSSNAQMIASIFLLWIS